MNRIAYKNRVYLLTIINDHYEIKQLPLLINAEKYFNVGLKGFQLNHRLNHFSFPIL